MPVYNYKTFIINLDFRLVLKDDFLLQGQLEKMLATVASINSPDTALNWQNTR